MATEEYESLTVAKLREIFKERKVSATGLTKKAQLIERLRAVDAEVEAAAGAVNGDAAEPAPRPQDDVSMADEPQDEIVVATSEARTEEKVPAANGVSEPSPEAQVEGDNDGQGDAKGIAEAMEPTKIQVETQPEVDATLVVGLPDTQSPPAEAAAEDTRKRKRRSPSPPVDEEAVAQKRQRQEVEPAHVTHEAPVANKPVMGTEEDIAVEDASRPAEDMPEVIMEPAGEVTMQVEDSHQAAFDAKESLPEQEEKAGEVAAATEESAQQAQTHPHPHPEVLSDQQRDARFRNLANTLDRDAASIQPVDDDEDRDIEPSRHPATSALYIRNLKRPIREVQIREHLHHLATNPSASATESEPADVQVYLDSLRTHAFALFPSISHATRVRTKLHNVVWPKERERDALFVDYIKEEQYHAFAQEEEAAIKAVGGRTSSMKRFEVAYFPTSGGEMEAELREQGAPGKGMPGAPTGPRQPVEPVAIHKRNTSDVAPDTPSFGALSRMFKSTEAKPILYFQPVPQRLVDQRLEELQAQSSRRLLSDEVGGGSGLPDSRRYTFEERGWMEGRIVTERGKEDGAYEGSARLCDNGPEFGLKVPMEFRRGRGGFRGGRGGRR